MSEESVRARYGLCSCGKRLRGGWTQCKGCKKGAAPTGAKAAQAKGRPAEVDVTDLITSLGLDYCVGNAARFLLECADGDELDNLTAARTYLDKAIAARSGV